jgi:hypothetical protein
MWVKLMCVWCRYSQGKATALVIDVGHQNTSVTALWEGMPLRKSEYYSFSFHYCSNFYDDLKHISRRST